jgi:predicted nucleic acid-binding protein
VTANGLDSSALVKRYVSEVGTTWVRRLVAPTAGYTLLVAQTTPVELVSALARPARAGPIAVRTARAARLLVDRHHVREYQVIRWTDEIVQRAEDLLERQPLRAADALQLASALAVHTRLIANNLPGLIFVSADQRLLSAATAEGLPSDNPDLHP